MAFSPAGLYPIAFHSGVSMGLIWCVKALDPLNRRPLRYDREEVVSSLPCLNLIDIIDKPAMTHHLLHKGHSLYAVNPDRKRAQGQDEFAQ